MGGRDQAWGPVRIRRVIPPGPIAAGRPMFNLVPLEVFEHGTLPVLVADVEGVVRLYNPAAANLFGCDMDEGCGVPCWRLARFRNPDGSPFCSRDCPIVREAAAEGTASAHAVALHRRARRDREAPRLFLLLTFAIPPRRGGRYAYLHVVTPHGGGQDTVHPVAGPGAPDLHPAAVATASERLHLLSEREREILDLLAQGLDAVDAADRLHLSPLTVRNHIQHILRKLRLHRQVDAILTHLRGPR